MRYLLVCFLILICACYWVDFVGLCEWQPQGFKFSLFLCEVLYSVFLGFWLNPNRDSGKGKHGEKKTSLEYTFELGNSMLHCSRHTEDGQGRGRWGKNRGQMHRSKRIRKRGDLERILDISLSCTPEGLSSQQEKAKDCF